MKSEICADLSHTSAAGVRADLAADVDRYLRKSPQNIAAGDSLKTRISAFLTPQLLCLAVYRIAHLLHVRRYVRLAIVFARINLLIHKITLPADSCIGGGCFIPHPVGVTFRGRAGRGLTLYSLAVCCPLEGSLDPAEGPVLGDRVTIAGRASLLGPVQVGSQVSIYAVRIDRDVASNSLVTGRESRQRFQAREQLERSGAIEKW